MPYASAAWRIDRRTHPAHAAGGERALRSVSVRANYVRRADRSRPNVSIGSKVRDPRRWTLRRRERGGDSRGVFASPFQRRRALELSNAQRPVSEPGLPLSRRREVLEEHRASARRRHRHQNAVRRSRLRVTPIMKPSTQPPWHGAEQPFEFTFIVGIEVVTESLADVNRHCGGLVLPTRPDFPKLLRSEAQFGGRMRAQYFKMRARKSRHSAVRGGEQLSAGACSRMPAEGR